jgi:hypothetical protein
MPVEQKSQIKHRRGLIADLPILEGSELGHVVDERRLFIGNGEIADGAPETGNTEIITEYTLLSNPDALKHIYRSNTSIIATTGLSPTQPIIRSYQQAIDDRLSIKSYGATGDGVTDDSTAINRALQDIYTNVLLSEKGSFRTIFFPAGEYILDLEEIYLPPNTHIFGEGMGRTVIRMVNASLPHVMATADSLFQIGIQIGNNSAQTPKNIQVSQMTLVHDADADVVNLQRSSSVSFHQVEFVGGWSAGPSSSQCVRIDPLGVMYQSRQIKLVDCIFRNCASVIDTSITGIELSTISFINCHAHDLYKGCFFNSQIQDASIINCLFENIELSAIFAGAASEHVRSVSNHFVDCGSSGNFPLGNPVIIFQGETASSVQCTFDVQPSVIPVFNQGVDSVILNCQQALTLNNIDIASLQQKINLTPNEINVNSGISLNVSVADTFFIDYALKRNNAVRSGRMFVVTDGTNVDLADLFSESAPTGISFDYNLSGNILNVTYSSDANGPGTLVYQIKSWLMN